MTRRGLFALILGAIAARKRRVRYDVSFDLAIPGSSYTTATVRFGQAFSASLNCDGIPPDILARLSRELGRQARRATELECSRVFSPGFAPVPARDLLADQ